MATDLDQFNRRYARILQARRETEARYHAALSRVFARQQKRTTKRLNSIRRNLSSQPSLTVEDSGPIQQDKTSTRLLIPKLPLKAPSLSAAEIYMEGFDEDLAEELGEEIEDETNRIGKALIGGAFTGLVIGAFVQSQRDRLAYIGLSSTSVVENILSSAWRHGDDYSTMSSLVEDVFSSLAGRAANAVARSEATVTLGGATQIAARIEGIEMDRMWLSMEDERVRDSHEDAHGQIVGNSEPFMVGGEELMFPGDPSASLKETANCRCIWVPVAVDGEAMLSPDDPNGDLAAYDLGDLEGDGIDVDPYGDDLGDTTTVEFRLARIEAFNSRFHDEFEFDRPEVTTPMSDDYDLTKRTGLFASGLADAFGWNPDQPRDEAGRFGEKTGDSKDSEAKQTPEERGLAVNAVVKEAVAAGKATEQKFEDGKFGPKGVWAPERARMHDAIIKEVLAKAADVPKDRQATFMGGLPGAGKGSVQKDPQSGIERGKSLVVDPDEIKQAIIAHGGLDFTRDDDVLSTLKPMEMASIIHEESSTIAGRIAVQAMNDGTNLTWDITMNGQRDENGDVQSGSVASRLADLERAGYQSHAVFVDVTPDTSAARAQARFEAKVDTDMGGRLVPTHEIMKMHDDEYGSINRGVYEKFKAEGRFETWQMWDNNGAAPVLVEKGP